MKARKKPITIECFQVTDDDGMTTKAYPTWLMPAVISGDIVLINPEDTTTFKVKSKEGWVKGKLGDYIMKGVEGELYICDEQIFNKTYDVVGE